MVQNIIKAGIEELDLVVDLFNKYRVFYKQSANEKECKRFIEERMVNQQSVIFLAMENQTPLGFVQLYPSFSSVSMKKLWILTDFRKKSPSSSV